MNFPSIVFAHSKARNFARIQPQDFGVCMVENHYNNYHKWYRWAYEQRYGKGSWDKNKKKEASEDKKGIPSGFDLYDPEIKRYWNEEKAIGVIERNLLVLHA